jgi:hypothetical protein
MNNRINVNHHEPMPGDHAEVRMRILISPPIDHIGIAAVLHRPAPSQSRRLGTIAERKDWHSLDGYRWDTT